MANPKHEQIRISHGELSADVDAGIAALILECWRHGLPTDFSCQGDDDGDRAYISFPTAEDALHFVHAFVPKNVPISVPREDDEQVKARDEVARLMAMSGVYVRTGGNRTAVYFRNSDIPRMKHVSGRVVRQSGIKTFVMVPPDSDS